MLNKLISNRFLRSIGRGVRNSLEILLHPHKHSSERYVSHLRSKGVVVGENTEFYSPTTCHVDVTRPSLVTIGDNVKITRGTTVLTHDYGWSVLWNKYGEVLGSAGRVKINDNVFIGNHVTVLKGAEIGENTIISSNSLVNKDIPSNVVAGGVPAEVIMPLNEFYEKRKREYIEEAKEYAKSIDERYDRRPKKGDFGEFFPIFLERKEENLRPEFRRRLAEDSQPSEKQIDEFLKSEPEFESFEDFLESCGILQDRDR